MNHRDDTGAGETLLFPCAGAAHCGRVAYQAAFRLAGEGQGNVFCLAAVAAKIEDKLERTCAAARRVALDGCDDHCARKTLEGAAMPVDVHLVLTDIGIERKPEHPKVTDDAARVATHVRGMLEAVEV